MCPLCKFAAGKDWAEYTLPENRTCFLLLQGRKSCNQRCNCIHRPPSSAVCRHIASQGNIQADQEGGLKNPPHALKRDSTWTSLSKGLHASLHALKKAIGLSTPVLPSTLKARAIFRLGTAFVDRTEEQGLAEGREDQILKSLPAALERERVPSG